MNLPSGFSRYCWSIVLVLSVAFFIWAFIDQLSIDETQYVENAFDSGARVEITLDTGEVRSLRRDELSAAVRNSTTLDDNVDTRATDDTAEDTSHTDLPSPSKEHAASEADSDSVNEGENAEALVVDDDGSVEDSPVTDTSDSTAATPSQPSAQTAAVSTVQKPKGHYVGVIVTGLGLSRMTTENALYLPSDVTMGFSPYSVTLDDWVAAARGQGHELMLELPMEPTHYPSSNPGPHALLSGVDTQKNLEHLAWILSRTNHNIGVYTPFDEKFTFALDKVSPILKALARERLLFIYGGETENASLMSLTKTVGTPAMAADVIIDRTLSRSTISAELEAAEHSIRRNGYALIIARPYPISIKMLQEWLATIEDKGITLVPLSELEGIHHSYQ